MIHLDLFGGIGGNSLALDTVFNDTKNTHIFCEIDPFCQAVLRKHWPEARIESDIRSFHYAGPVDIVTGGFPCQPFSFAGDRLGAEDDRDLWPEMFRVIKECRPTWVIGENVAGFTGMELDRSISDLESAGYAVRTFDIPAIGVDARHIRHRIWIVAYASKEGSGGLSVLPEKRRKPHQSTHARRRGPDMANANKGGSSRGQHEGNEEKRWEKPSGSDRLRGDVRGGYVCEWPVEPQLGRVAHGIPDRVDRVGALGNSIVPQVAMEIMRAIKNSSINNK